MHAEAQQYGAKDIVSEEGRVKSEEFKWRVKNLIEGRIYTLNLLKVNKVYKEYKNTSIFQIILLILQP